MDRIKSICIEEELCQSHDGSLEQILKQMLSYKKLYALQCRCKNWGKGFCCKVLNLLSNKVE